MPATYMIGAGGKLSPQTVSAPAFIAVQITVSTTGSGTLHVIVKTPTPHSLTVTAGHAASVQIPGQRIGHYPIVVDGTVRGALDIGGDAGP